MLELTKRQEKTIKAISRWADGHCTNSKAYKTNQQLKDLGLLKITNDAVILTKQGREVAEHLQK